MTDGVYCNVISGQKNNDCTRNNRITVTDGVAYIFIRHMKKVPIIAFHKNVSKEIRIMIEVNYYFVTQSLN